MFIDAKNKTDSATKELNENNNAQVKQTKKIEALTEQVEASNTINKELTEQYKQELEQNRQLKQAFCKYVMSDPNAVANGSAEEIAIMLNYKEEEINKETESNNNNNNDTEKGSE